MRTIVLFLTVACFPSFSSAGLILEFESSDLELIRIPSTTQQASVDVIARHDGFGLDTLSAFTIQVADSAPPGLSITTPVNSPLTWTLGQPSVTSVVGGTAIGAANLGNHTISSAPGGTVLATVTFEVDSSVGTSAVFPLDLTVTTLNRDGLTDILPEATAIDSSFTVTPEPSAFLLAAGSCLFALACRRRLRRRDSH